MQSSQAEIIQQSQNEYLLSGVIDFSTASKLVQQSLSFFKSKKHSDAGAAITIDLSKVSSCNSAGIALMLEMVKNAQINNIELRFENLPDSLLTMAKSYGVEDEIRDICK